MSLLKILKKIKAFPNPTFGEIYLNNANVLNKNYKIRNVFGQLMQNDIVVNNKINITNLASGVYYLLIDNYENVIKIIKE